MSLNSLYVTISEYQFSKYKRSIRDLHWGRIMLAVWVSLIIRQTIMNMIWPGISITSNECEPHTGTEFSLYVENNTKLHTWMYWSEYCDVYWRWESIVVRYLPNLSSDWSKHKYLNLVKGFMTPPNILLYSKLAPCHLYVTGEAFG